MGNGGELKEYRQKILTALINNHDICELVLNRNVTTITADIQDELTNNHIFKYAFVPNVQDDEKTFIAFEINGRTSNNTNLYKNISLSFFIFSHANVIRYKTGHLRTDLIDECVQDLFNENNDFGVGLMYCTEDKYLKVSNNYYGRQLTFKVKDMNVSRCN